MAHDVFIAYSSKDKSVADAICTGLEAAEIRCWVAPRDVGPTMTSAEAITQAIEASRLFILVFSRTSNKADDVFREMSLAARWGIPIVAYRIQRAKPIERMEYYLEPNKRLAIDASHVARFQELTETVQLLLKGGSS